MLNTFSMEITAYHVSRIGGLTEIQPHLCNSKDRDELALNLKAACFTTTRYKGGLPTISTYPRNFEDGEYGHRYTMEFDPRHFFKFQMAETTVDDVTQVHYLLLRRDDPVEGKLADFIRACVPLRENRYWDRYFPGGQANEYTEDKTFVNVLFVHEVPVTWSDKVEKRGPVFNLEQLTDTAVWYERMLQEARRTERLADVAAWIEQVVQQAAGNHTDPIPNHEDDQEAEDDDDVDNLTAGFEMQLGLR
ncbi:hypothetical protein BBJ29_008399 [Phytophthora kernoviae]|uniref:Uncharacterized protein n=1 Tax=Phytophthora kernoviae TaxID=325452 RepID=A0A3R7H1U5_9STRA|nr:hypothetical protein BBJ29_008399 [Phytophthora kernoviae]